VAVYALAEHACKIDSRLRYEFSSRLLGMLVGPVFTLHRQHAGGCFVKRAEKSMQLEETIAV
jgi:ribosome-associated toxin RatA of RatAB toxin-antitoxin module